MKYLIYYSFLVLTLFFIGCEDEAKRAPGSIAKISPSSGRVGSPVKIKGAGFSSIAANNKVTFNGTPAFVMQASDTLLFVLAPQAAKAGPVVVTVDKEVITGPSFSFYAIYAYGRHGSVATFWEDDKSNRLTDGFNLDQVNDLAVAGNDTHAAGSELNAPRYWKNVYAESLGGFAPDELSAIAVSGSDVHMTGLDFSTAGKAVIKYWKNGEVVTVSDLTKNSFISDIAVSGSDVHICWTENDNNGKSTIKYWKNGVVTDITDGTTKAYANKIALFGSDVYICGREDQSAKYWKNGMATSLTVGDMGATANDIFVFGTDIFVAGSQYKCEQCDNTLQAVLWKNGVAKVFDNGANNSEGVSIIIAGEETIFVERILDSQENMYQLLGSKMLINDEPFSPFLGTDPNLWLKGSVLGFY